MKKVCWLIMALSSMVFAQNKPLLEMDGYLQVMNPQTMVAITEPEFVPAIEAQIPDPALVVGVTHKGQAKAFSLNVLTRFPVVNDEIGGQPFALVWGAVSNTALAFDRAVSGQQLNFEPTGGLYQFGIVVRDQQSQSYWATVSGSAIEGQHKGKSLARLPIVRKTTFREWKKLHPNTTVWAVDGRSHTDQNPFLNYYRSPKTFKPVKPDKRSKVPPKAGVFGFNLDGITYAATHQGSTNGWFGKAGKKKVFFYRPAKAPPMYGTLAYVMSHGGQDIKLKGKNGVWESKQHGKFDPVSGAFANGGITLERIDGFDTFWYVWNGYHDKTKIINPPKRGFSRFNQPNERGLGADDPFRRR